MYIYNRKCGNCILSSNGDGDLLSNLCSTLLINITECECNESKYLSNCFNSCLPPCEETMFETTGLRKKEDTVGIITAKFVMTSIESGVLTFQEVQSYSFQSAVSNVGGQLGLWLGISVITGVQVILFWLDKLLDWRSSSSSISGIPKLGRTEYFVANNSVNIKQLRNRKRPFYMKT